MRAIGEMIEALMLRLHRPRGGLFPLDQPILRDHEVPAKLQEPSWAPRPREEPDADR